MENHLERELLDWDYLVGADAQTVSRAMYCLIDELQRFPKEIQLLAATTLFIRLCEVFRVKYTSDILQIGQNIIDKNRHLEQFQAVGDYIKYELF